MSRTDDRMLVQLLTAVMNWSNVVFSFGRPKSFIVW